MQMDVPFQNFSKDGSSFSKDIPVHLLYAGACAFSKTWSRMLPRRQPSNKHGTWRKRPPKLQQILGKISKTSEDFRLITIDRSVG